MNNYPVYSTDKINLKENTSELPPAELVSKPRILIFIGSLRSGGKERRLIELLTYFRTKHLFEFLVVLTRNEIHYKDFFKLDIPHKVIYKKWKRNDLTIFYQFYQICKQYRPHLIHTWGQMQSFYALPAVLGQRVPLVNSQITGAPEKPIRSFSFNLINRLNFRFSTVVIANSKAGIEAFHPPVRKSKVIYNGINLNRFKNLPLVDEVKEKYGITTPYAVLMAASFSPTKNYGLFYQVAEKVTRLRNDITFLGVGAYDFKGSEYTRLVEKSSGNNRILFPGRINDVEALVNACTIGVLFSANGEGISNSIMEYMALGKPVIAHKAGGTKELVRHNENGFLIENEADEEIAQMIIDLIDNQEKRQSFGEESKRIIEAQFSLDSMGKAFEHAYKEALTD